MSAHLLNYLGLLFSVGWCSLLLLKHTASWVHAYSFLHTFSVFFFVLKVSCAFSLGMRYGRGSIIPPPSPSASPRSQLFFHSFFALLPFYDA
ncbi:hypothetical protein BKA57DRAFT_453407 [Linnemannia elongata]|nr:hypothetical protein BKA57DRAFT_453407 [Linnemannia elongata]